MGPAPPPPAAIETEHGFCADEVERGGRRRARGQPHASQREGCRLLLRVCGDGKQTLVGLQPLDVAAAKVRT
eukprot:365639-Chlamydomonas_euryale.AAC.11